MSPSVSALGRSAMTSANESTSVGAVRAATRAGQVAGVSRRKRSMDGRMSIQPPLCSVPSTNSRVSGTSTTSAPCASRSRTACSMSAVVSARPGFSGSSSNDQRTTPIRFPASASVRRPATYASVGCWSATSVSGSAGSRPASTSMRSAASATVVVIGPTTSCRGERGTTPAVLVRPIVGRNPTRLWCAAGPSTDPHESVPRPAGA
ncbi:hypothetical protein BFL36_06955 [Clavibacter michiganensis]|uniref:Uncharacterized protein n=1 Tax=Clavibacter michiganensis TaxID=28447 RepID=A0A251YIM3_9MICO|nr:hypothetical protein BFL36_06955 [Clavibacter michiganensis]